MSPEAPTNAPLIIRALLPKTNPVAAAAIPEYEFNKDIIPQIMIYKKPKFN